MVAKSWLTALQWPKLKSFSAVPGLRELDLEHFFLTLMLCVLLASPCLGLSEQESKASSHRVWISQPGEVCGQS